MTRIPSYLPSQPASCTSAWWVLSIVLLAVTISPVPAQAPEDRRILPALLTIKKNNELLLTKQRAMLKRIESANATAQQIRIQARRN